MRKFIKYIFIFSVCAISILFFKNAKFDRLTLQTEFFAKYTYTSYDTVKSVPEFNGNTFVVINNNIPDFNVKDLKTSTFDTYSKLDKYNRAGFATACIGKESLPTTERGSLSGIFPAGWYLCKDKRFNNEKLFNKCHLIGHQLSGETSIYNIIIGTKYFNNSGMLPFENLVADYVKSSDNHVLYRVTPIYNGSNLLADGVQIEAMSVEDNGREICFNVFIYNAQPNLSINYKTGEIIIAE